MFDDLGNGQAANYLLAIGIVAVALLALFFVFWLIRRRSNSTFIRGGKNRQPRLAVLDAAAVDTRRRLVLVRRDGVEHLILIGGPTDVVIESGIVQADFPQSDFTRSSLTQANFARSEPDAALQAEKARHGAGVVHQQPIASPVRQPTPLTPSGPASPSAAAKPIVPKAATPAAPTTATPGASSSIAAATVATTVAVIPEKDAAENALDALDAARARVLSTPDRQVPKTSEVSHPLEPTPTSAPANKAAYEPPAAIADAYFDNDTASTSPSQPPTAPVFQGQQPDRATLVATPTSSNAVSARQIPVTPAPLTGPNRQQPGMSDFEAILEAELAEDFDIDDNLGIDEATTALYTGGDLSSVTPGDQPRDVPAKTVKQDSARTDTLEDEMDKLLGDLSRRN